jgi:hypothetical protein
MSAPVLRSCYGKSVGKRGDGGGAWGWKQGKDAGSGALISCTARPREREREREEEEEEEEEEERQEKPSAGIPSNGDLCDGRAMMWIDRCYESFHVITYRILTHISRD